MRSAGREIRVSPRYFDANATTASTPAVVAVVAETASIGPLNPSSAHSMGDRARAIVTAARDTVCDALGASDPDNIFFVSGGTEGNNIVLNGFARLAGGRILFSAVEHASISEPARAHCGSELPIGGDGIVDLHFLSEALAAMPLDAPVLVCIQAANSETGVIQPLEEIASVCTSSGSNVFLHVDAAQAFGRIPLPFALIDSITMSGHKLHAPGGSGFLYMSDGLIERLPRTVLGGGQERGVRSGTENVVAIAGLGAAVRERFSDFEGNARRLAALRDMLEQELRREIPGLSFIGSGSNRTPNTSNVMFPDVDAMALMANLDDLGIICSNGSACSSRKPSPSHVLTAMGLTEKEAFSCLRFSLSVLNTEAEIASAAGEISSAYHKLKALHEYR